MLVRVALWLGERMPNSCVMVRVAEREECQTGLSTLDGFLLRQHPWRRELPGGPTMDDRAPAHTRPDGTSDKPTRRPVVPSGPPDESYRSDSKRRSPRPPWAKGIQGVIAIGHRPMYGQKRSQLLHFFGGEEL